MNIFKRQFPVKEGIIALIVWIAVAVVEAFVVPAKYISAVLIVSMIIVAGGLIAYEVHAVTREMREKNVVFSVKSKEKEKDEKTVSQHS